MGFSINPNHLPVLRSYAEADALERSIVPIRGKTVKPLGKRSAQHMKIERESGTDNIVCILFATPCVTFCPNDTAVLNYGGWASLSTAGFINRVYGRGSTSLKRNQILYTHRSGTFALPPFGLTLDANGVPLNPPRCTVHTINRKNLAAIRQQYVPYLEYALVVRDMTSGAFTDPHSPGLYPNGPLLPSQNELESPEDWYPLVLRAMWQCSYTQYDHAANTWVRKCTASGLRNILMDEIYKLHPHYVFDTEVLPIGEHKHDKYRKYF